MGQMLSAQASYLSELEQIVEETSPAKSLNLLQNFKLKFGQKIAGKSYNLVKWIREKLLYQLRLQEMATILKRPENHQISHEDRYSMLKDKISSIEFEHRSDFPGFQHPHNKNITNNCPQMDPTPEIGSLTSIITFYQRLLENLSQDQFDPQFFSEFTEKVDKTPAKIRHHAKALMRDKQAQIFLKDSQRRQLQEMRKLYPGAKLPFDSEHQASLKATYRYFVDQITNKNKQILTIKSCLTQFLDNPDKSSFDAINDPELKNSLTLLKRAMIKASQPSVSEIEKIRQLERQKDQLNKKVNQLISQCQELKKSINHPQNDNLDPEQTQTIKLDSDKDMFQMALGQFRQEIKLLRQVRTSFGSIIAKKQDNPQNQLKFQNLENENRQLKQELEQVKTRAEELSRTLESQPSNTLQINRSHKSHEIQLLGHTQELISQNGQIDIEKNESLLQNSKEFNHLPQIQQFQSQIASLQEENKVLQQTNTVLKEQNQQLQLEAKALNLKVDVKQEQIQILNIQLQRKTAQLETQNRDLGSNTHQQEKDIQGNAIRQELEALKEQIKMLKEKEVQKTKMKQQEQAVRSAETIRIIQQFDQLQKQQQELLNKLQIAIKDRQKLEDDKKEMDQQIQNLEHQKTRLQKDNKQLQDEKLAIEQKNHALTQQLQNFKYQKNTTEEELHEIKMKLNEVNQEMKQNIEKNTNNIPQLQSKIIQLEIQLASQKDKNKATKDHYVKKAKEISGILQTQNGKLAQELEDYKGKYCQLQKSAAIEAQRLKEVITEKENSFNDLMSIANAKDAEAMKLKDQIKEKDNKLSELAYKMKQKDVEGQKLRDQIKAREKNEADLKELFKTKENEILKLKDTIRLKEKKQSDLTATIKTKEAEMQKLKDQLKEKDKNLSDHTLAMKAKDTELQKVKEQLKAKEKNYSDLASSIKTKETEILKLKEQVRNKEKALNDLSTTVKAKDVEIGNLSSKFLQAQSKYQQIERYTRKVQSQRKELQIRNNKLSQHLEQMKISFLKQMKRLDPRLHALFANEIFEKDFEGKTRLITMIENYSNKKILSSRLLYRYDPLNSNNVHKYIDDKPGLLCVTMTKNAVVACFYPGALRDKVILNEGGLIMSVTNNKSYALAEKTNPNDKKIYKGMVYDQYYVIFGNSEFRLKSGTKEVMSMFNTNASYYNNRGDKVSCILNEGDKNETAFELCEYYQVFFEENNN